jgi:3-hydroxyisobutyrate dehydrogenase-like beta-hydroxyacid dehydrogenase
MIVKNDFTPFFKLDLALKDLRLASKVAEDMGVDAKAFKMATDYFAHASDAGFGDEDAIAVYKVVGDK